MQQKTLKTQKVIGWKEENTNETVTVNKEMEDLAVLACFIADVLLEVVKESWFLCSVSCVFQRSKNVMQ